MNRIKLIYISTDNIGLVLEGQVYKLLEYYQRLEVFSEIVLLQPYNSEQVLEDAKKVLRNYSFRTVYFKASDRIPWEYFSTLNSLKNVLEMEMTPESVIHARSNLLSPVVRKALPKSYRDAYILTEFRGLTIDELRVANRGRWIDRLYVSLVKLPYARHLLNILYKDKRTRITAVSPYFKEVIMKEGVPTELISVHPNIVSSEFVFSEESRHEIREKHGISDSQPIAILSSGVGNIWQSDDVTIDRLLELGFVVFNLGKNKVEREGVINALLPRSEMPKYLSAADVAVLWREDVPLNNVACPSKFGEFVTMGLYVIHNGTVDIAKRFIEDNDAGIIVSKPEEIVIGATKFDFEERRKRCVAGYEMFSVERIAESYISHYKNRN